MSLTEKLNDLKQQLGQEIPREILEEIGLFLKGLSKSGIVEKSCGVGDKMPSFALPNVTGKVISSADLLSRGPMVLSFYRGIW